MECLECFCCCFDFARSPLPPRPSSTKKKVRRSAIETRLVTKYKKEQILLVSDEDRKAKKTTAYCCPICTNYYTKILACKDCTNCICRSCFQIYDDKSLQHKKRMQCPFCNSKTSVFTDYQLQPHSYFDTTTKGFLSLEERIKIDSELNLKQPSKEQPNSPLETIQQQRQN